MAATALTPQPVSRAGYDHTGSGVAADTANGNKWLNTGAESLVVTAGGTQVVVTISWGANASIDGATPASKTVTVPANHTSFIGTFSPSAYNDASGYVTVNYDHACTVSVVRPG